MSTNDANQAMFSRRAVMRFGAAGLVALGAPSLGWAAAAKRGRKIPIGVQLYSVRKDCAKDFDGTLKRIAEMGFEGVEFAGYHQYKEDPKGLRKKLDELKLKAAGTHVPADSFAPDKLKQTIDFHKTIGCKFLIVPMDKRFFDPEKSQEFATIMKEASVPLKKAGLFCGYHNHTQEFAVVDQAGGGKTYWDLFAERTPKDVILQLDIGWAQVAKLDPAQLVRKYPGRIKTGHFKAKLPKEGAPEGKKAIIGQDLTDWKSVITACQEAGGTEWMVLEQEDYPDGLEPMDAVKQSLDGLKKILAEMRA